MKSSAALTGFALILAGLWMAWPPLAFIFAGVMVLAAVLDV